jgi:hypothetical protein
MTVVRVSTAALAALLLALALAACGGSSAAKSPTTTAAASTPGGGAAPPSGGAAGPGGGAANPARRAAIVACLRKQGITLPPGFGPGGGAGRPGGGGPGGPGGPFGPSGPRGPQSGARGGALRAALAKCGIQPGQLGGGGARNNPAFRSRLTAFAACMRSNGVNLPAPTTSGSGPVFGNVNRSDPKFSAAYAKCQSTLGGSFGRGGQPRGA